MVLILALRSGNTEAFTFSDIYRNAAAHPGNIVEWLHPDKPVICAFNIRSGIDWSKLAPVQKANRSLQRALDIMGLADKVSISAHQLRHGFASDLTMTKPNVTGHSRDQISDALAHSGFTRTNTDTVLTYSRMYSAEDTWTARLDLTPRQANFSELVASTGSASNMSLKRAVQDDEGEGPRRRRPRTVISVPHGEDDEADVEESGEKIHEFDIDDIIQPQQDEAPEDGDIIEILSQPMTSEATNASGKLTAALTSTRDEFVDVFSGVNIVRAPHKGGSYLEYAKRCGNDSSNSVDKMTKYMVYCAYAPNGCSYSAPDIHQLQSHQIVCRFMNAAYQDPKKDRPIERFGCPYEGCDKNYGGQREVESHIIRKHKYTQCWVDKCAERKIFAGEDALLIHFRTAHPAKGRLHPTIPDQTDAKLECPIDGCEAQFNHCLSKNNYTNPNFLSHLLIKHGVDDEAERKKLQPTWAGNPCFHPNCESEICYPGSKQGRADYEKHLSLAHGVHDSDLFEYTWARVRGKVLPQRPAEDKARAPRTRRRPAIIEDGDE
ncbi:hypothetical protein B5807_00053 [Epicoccum nigrum]|uniref:C2H2-type domain-containing protein n=1 Tax=Epicoccum nigrum TaxID=105696 RepID=A0A1Y2MEF9_EPING|nr:hypothetical protein B5807_00053 [Epicoccum nigrum]